MKNCLNGHSVDELYDFCPTCGNPASMMAIPTEGSGSGSTSCIKCGAILENGDSFCGRCGGPIVNPPFAATEAGSDRAVAALTVNHDGQHSIPLDLTKGKPKALFVGAMLLIAVQFVLSGTTGAHAGSRTLAVDHMSQWKFSWNLLNYKFAYFGTWRPIAPMDGWIFKIQSALIVAAIALCIVRFVGKFNRGQIWMWLTIGGLSLASVLASSLSILRASQLDFDQRDFWWVFRTDVTRLMQGGITITLVVWLVLSLSILATAIGGLLQSRTLRHKKGGKITAVLDSELDESIWAMLIGHVGSI